MVEDGQTLLTGRPCHSLGALCNFRGKMLPCLCGTVFLLRSSCTT